MKLSIPLTKIVYFRSVKAGIWSDEFFNQLELRDGCSWKTMQSLALPIGKIHVFQRDEGGSLCKLVIM